MDNRNSFSGGFDPDRELEDELNAAEAAMHGDDCDCHDCWRPDLYYVLSCLVCKPEAPMPFLSAAERGKWAQAHIDGTGHNAWQAWEETRVHA